MESYNECNNVDINVVQEDKNIQKEEEKISDDAPLLDTF